jgi:hypothetical protein
MPKDLFPRITAVDYEEYGSLQVKAVEQRDEDLLIWLVVTADEDPSLPESILKTCHLHRENTLVPGHYASIDLMQNHVLLWDYNQPHIFSSFYGNVQDPLAVVGALYERHIELVGKWIPFSKYLNCHMPLSKLIGGAFGLLADGPETLVLAYEEVLSNYGVSVAHHNNALEHYETPSILILDEAYVIGNAFFVEAR